jgi:hypothetical protein
VLLARRQRQHEAAAAVDIEGFAGQASRHLPHEALARGEQTHRRPAESGGVAE